MPYEIVWDSSYTWIRKSNKRPDEHDVFTRLSDAKKKVINEMTARADESTPRAAHEYMECVSVIRTLRAKEMPEVGDEDYDDD